MNSEDLYNEYMITGMVSGFQPLTVDSASGCIMRNAAGEEYLDCFSGISVCNAGHGHPDVISAATAQMKKLIHCCTYVYYNPRAAELAKLLAEVTPGKLQKSFFGNSGAEAVEGALRIAKQHTGRREMIALSMSFHGRTAATLSITGNSTRKKGNDPYLPGVTFAPAPYCYRCPFKLEYPACGCACAEHLDYQLRYNTSGDVAAFIAEPVLGEGGIIIPPPEYFRIATQIIRDNGALFICDEVQSGFGRTGKLFAIEHYDIEPEIMCMAKGIADVFPLGAFIVEPQIAEAFSPGDHLSTFGGNPVSCAAAIANMGVMQNEQLPENATLRGAQIVSRLTKIAESTPLIGDVRAKGLMIGIELVKDSDKAPALAEAKEVQRLCFESGLLVGIGGVLGNVVRLQPPLVITETEASKAVDLLEVALKSVGGE